ncbi:MAG: Glycosyl transferase family 2 [Candidatus Uhrbacteria bacterium GW2011_GWD2_41_121]|uniref:Glycosyl transferase family 2 n=1 Tax=Candidatus Uhrbacteria bacterium GW2011_GWC1_41_20 TaxID=1618983 RepID=A0A0G0VJF2_9BACT|nr:MAG: Glycosyl transferase family 2 [Candidatus Uhrbacteria bacterium GW2011_GWE1_39_46]KKR64296.1 MAG: Glycosyl transferase family 2 [Candidatus Uhrbacteria bacterium GW2011_GWC2_40_450]KKR89932.1 MAG: Glycosyl transferase family 2 [Candidatus Uhrbacteria bacterium GW2011_GWE2_41_1153]KKR90466.1 MAG: Glycosyl transferase family 2 [Candidatus Uhrbacteria bacterium GW2011_GWD2_41_121]KKR96171.1 MAG: Glycosyl transferase family 2 [Candidatus Uhrbacteria bacterium GW2011_GWD1_41_16]KKR99731.1 M
MSDKAQQLDLSIIIVHTFEKYLIRQTLDSIRRAAPKLGFEIIVVDNNPGAGFGEMARAEFPQVRHIPLERNVGFGSAMNRGIDVARGRYVLIFNPDIVIQPESLETMLEFMDANPEVGMCGPQLRNPDGSLQYSCYRSPTLMVPAYRRTFLGKFGVGKQAIEDYLMMDQSHDQQMEVDSLIGAALFTRKTALDEVGSFDERFFMYYEDNDLCRRFWEHGHKVVYYPNAHMIHYHRRASADGGLLQQMFNKFTWIQINSAIKFFYKYRSKESPRK